jgi:H+-transporting ATPase
VLFLAAGLIMTGQAILTPMLMVLMMVTGDFLSMSSATDNVRPSPTPSVWKIGSLTTACIILGLFDLLFCVACFSTGRFLLNLDTGPLRTLTAVTLVFSGQAVFYVARERQHLWSSRPGKWLIVSSAVDLTLFSLLAVNGVLMRPLAIAIVAGLLAAAVIFCLFLDLLKVALFRHLRIA